MGQVLSGRVWQQWHGVTRGPGRVDEGAVAGPVHT